ISSPIRTTARTAGRRRWSSPGPTWRSSSGGFDSRVPVVVWEEPHEPSTFEPGQSRHTRGRAVTRRRTDVTGEGPASIALALRSSLPRDDPVPAKAPRGAGGPPGGHLTERVAGAGLLLGWFGLFGSRAGGDRHRGALR